MIASLTCRRRLRRRAPSNVSHMPEREMAVVGLATMGMNLSRNLASHGARVAVYNRTRKRTDDFMSQHGSEGDFRAAGSLGELVRILKPPRAILLMVKAGAPVAGGLNEVPGRPP